MGRVIRFPTRSPLGEFLPPEQWLEVCARCRNVERCTRPATDPCEKLRRPAARVGREKPATVLPFRAQTTTPALSLADAGWRCLLCPNCKECRELCPEVRDAFANDARSRARRESLQPPKGPEGKGA